MGTEQAQQQGKPIDLADVRAGDLVLMVRTYSNGHEQTAKGAVLAVNGGCIQLPIPGGSFASWCIYSVEDFTTSLFLLDRPPQRVEISNDDLILKTPLGTRIVLVKNNGGEIKGTLWATGRTVDGLSVYLAPDRFYAAEVRLGDIKAIYTEEVYG